MLKAERRRPQLRFLRAKRATPQQPPDKGVKTSSHGTTDSRPNRLTDPGAKLVHAGDRAHRCDARTSVRQSPEAGTHQDRQGPGRHHHSFPQRTACMTLIYPLTHHAAPSRCGAHCVNPVTTSTRTHSPHPKISTPAQLARRSQAAHLQSVRTSNSFAQCGCEATGAGQATGRARARLLKRCREKPKGGQPPQRA